MLRHPRLSVLAASALLFACGGDPAPKEVEHPRPAKTAKSKKKHKSEDAEASDPQKSKEEKQRELDREAEKEKEERKERQRKREQEEAADSDKQVATSDDASSSSDDSGETADNDADAKKDTADEAKAKKKADQDDAKAKKKAAREEALAKKKAAREEAAEKKKAAADEAKAKKLAAAEAKKNKKKKKKAKGDADDATESSEGEPTKSDEETTAAADEKSEKDEKDEKGEKGEKDEKDEKDEKKVAKDEAPKTKKKSAKESKAKKKVAKADDADEAAAKKESDEESTGDDEAAAPKKVAKGKARKGKRKDADKDDKKDEKKDEKKDDEKAAKSDDESIDMEETSTAVRDPSHDSDELDLNAKPTTQSDEVAVAPPTTLEIDQRPLTTAKGKLEAHGGLRVTTITTPGVMGAKSTTNTSEGFGIGATYGVGNKAELGFDYTVGLHPGSAKGPLLLHGAYRVVESGKLDMAIAAGFAVDFIPVLDPTTMMTSTQTATALQLGGWVRYRAAHNLSIFTGLPALPSSSGSLLKVAALPPLPYQLSIGFGGGAIALDLPVGAGYQATPKIYAFASLDLAHIGMSNTTSAFVFADFIPFALGGFYAAGKIDIGAVIGDDLKQAADYLHIDVVARFALK